VNREARSVGTGRDSLRLLWAPAETRAAATDWASDRRDAKFVVAEEPSRLKTPVASSGSEPITGVGKRVLLGAKELGSELLVGTREGVTIPEEVGKK
jgi:hypothetical protein